jgi:hypothetical protein
MTAENNPFAALSLIVAPAILTNACSVLILSTSNRLARAVDRARELARQIEGSEHLNDAVSARRLRELGSNEQRSVLLLRAIRSCYIGLSGFATATLVSLVGAVLLASGRGPLTALLEAAALLSGMIAVGALIYASLLLVRDTRLAVLGLQERAAGLQFRARQEEKRAP